MTVHCIITQYPLIHAERIHILCEAAIVHMTILSQRYQEVETALSASQIYYALSASVDTHPSSSSSSVTTGFLSRKVKANTPTHTQCCK